MPPTFAATGTTSTSNSTSSPKIRELKQAVKEDPASVTKRETLISQLIGARELEDAFQQCEAGSDALGHTPEWLDCAVTLYGILHKSLPPGGVKDKATGHLIASLVAKLHTSIGADKDASAKLLLRLNAARNDLASTARDGSIAAAYLCDVNITEELRAQLFHLMGLHLLFYSGATRYSNQSTLAAVSCFVESAATPCLTHTAPAGRLGDRILRQFETLSRAREAEAHALIARAEQSHHGAVREALAASNMVRETLAAQIGLDRNHLTFVTGLLEVEPSTMPLAHDKVHKMIERVLRENLGNLHYVVRLISTASLPPPIVYSLVADVDRDLYDSAPPLPRHETDAHVKGQPCLDDAVSFLWALSWKCDPQRGLSASAAPGGRSSFPNQFQITELQHGFWNALLAARAPLDGSIDFSGRGVLTDAQVALRCIELRQWDTSLPLRFISEVGRCFESAAAAAAVQADRDALLRRAEDAYSAGYATVYGSEKESVPHNSTFGLATTPSRSSARRGAAASPRSYPSPFRPRTPAQHALSRGSSPVFSPLRQRANQQTVRSSQETTLLQMPIVNQTAAPGDAEDVLTSYARVLRALTTDRPIDLERFERTVEVLSRLGADGSISPQMRSSARRDCGLLRLRFVREAAKTLNRLTESRRAPAVRGYLGTLSDAEKDFDACIGGEHEVECATAIAQIEELKGELRHTVGSIASPRPRSHEPAPIPMWHAASPNISPEDSVRTLSPIQTPLRERVKPQSSPITQREPPVQALTPYEQRRLRNADMLRRAEVLPRSSSTDSSVIVPQADDSPFKVIRGPIDSPGPAPTRGRRFDGSVPSPKIEENPAERQAPREDPPTSSAFNAVLTLLKTELSIEEDYTSILRAMGVSSVDDLALVQTAEQLQDSGFKLIPALKIIKHFQPERVQPPLIQVQTQGIASPGLWSSGGQVPMDPRGAPTPNQWGSTAHRPPPLSEMAPPAVPQGTIDDSATSQGQNSPLWQHGVAPSPAAPTPEKWTQGGSTLRQSSASVLWGSGKRATSQPSQQNSPGLVPNEEQVPQSVPPPQKLSHSKPAASSTDPKQPQKSVIVQPSPNSVPTSTTPPIDNLLLPANLLDSSAPIDAEISDAVLHEHLLTARSQHAAQSVTARMDAAQPINVPKKPTTASTPAQDRPPTQDRHTPKTGASSSGGVPVSSTPLVPEGYVDVTSTGDQSVLKKILREGRGDSRPPDASEVTVHYVGKLVQTQIIFDASRKRNTPYKFKIGSSKSIKGMSEAVVTMKHGEKASFIFAPQKAYGTKGYSTIIPPNAALEFELELITWTAPDGSSPVVKGFSTTKGSLSTSGFGTKAKFPLTSNVKSESTVTQNDIKPTTQTAPGAGSLASRFQKGGKLDFAKKSGSTEVTKKLESTPPAQENDKPAPEKQEQTKPVTAPGESAKQDATAATSKGFAGFGKAGGRGGFAELATKGGGFKKAGPGEQSIFSKPVQPMFGNKSKTSPAKSAGDGLAADGDDDAGGAVGDGITGDDGIRFEAIVKLTKVETLTGEEGWEEVGTFECRLWRWGETNSGPGWKERGKGTIKIQKNGNSRLLMRRPETKKLCCNQTISSNIKLTNYKDQDNFVSWTSLDGSGDEATDPKRPYLFLMKLKDKDVADHFKATYAQCQAEYKAGRTPTGGATSAGGSDGAAAGGEGKPAIASGFRNISGNSTVWRCENCFVEVPLDVTKCGACGSVKPGTAPSSDADKKAEPKSTHSFGSQSKAGAKTGAPSTSKFGTGTGAGSKFSTSFKPKPPAGPQESAPTPSNGGATATETPKLSFAFGTKNKSVPPTSSSANPPPKAPPTKNITSGIKIAEFSLADRAAAKNILATQKAGETGPNSDPSAMKPPSGSSPTKAGSDSSKKLNFTFGKASTFALGKSANPTAPAPNTTTTKSGQLNFRFGATGGKASTVVGGGGDDDDGIGGGSDEWEDDDDGTESIEGGDETEPASEEEEEGAESEQTVPEVVPPAPATVSSRKIITGRRKPKS
eukprot:m.141628 g.141628  ORF g.141628 m.141628 type:complete len:2007 (+) comp14051_c0_seq1:120-6140(+)